MNTPEELSNTARILKKIEDRLSTEIIGQEVLKRRLLTALLTGGHILLEGVTSLAKTR